MSISCVENVLIYEGFGWCIEIRCISIPVSKRNVSRDGASLKVKRGNNKNGSSNKNEEQAVSDCSLRFINHITPLPASADACITLSPTQPPFGGSAQQCESQRVLCRHACEGDGSHALARATARTQPRDGQSSSSRTDRVNTCTSECKKEYRNSSNPAHPKKISDRRVSP